MSYQEMFALNLVDLEVEGNTQEEVFQVIADKLNRLGFVYPTYLDGLTKREQRFPTGLVTQHLNIALPHCDPEHIQKPFVFICRLKKEVSCLQMGDSQEMDVKDFFFLGIKEGTQQVGLLQSFMNLFMDQDFVSKYKKTTNSKEVYQMFYETI